MWESAISGFVVFALTPSKLNPTYNAMQYGLLDARQHEAIAMLLEYMTTNADGHCRRDAERVLGAWRSDSRIAGSSGQCPLVADSGHALSKLATVEQAK